MWTKLNDAANDSDDAILAAWDVGPIIARRTPARGTLNRTLLIETPCGSYALRAYRHTEREPIEREHNIIAYAHTREILAVAPLPLANGDTIFERDSSFYALFPRAPGQQFARASLKGSEFMAMGRCLALLHNALHSYSPERVARRTFAVDTAATLHGIARIEALIHARAALDDTDQRVLAQFAARRALLAGGIFTETTGFNGLEQQVIHGDYQDSNLFFEHDSVVAVIDWENAYVAPCAWEIARTLDLVCCFNGDTVDTFLSAYRAVQPIEDAALDIAIRQYWLIRLHDLWLYETYYVHNNMRLRAFVAENDAAAMAERWCAV